MTEMTYETASNAMGPKYSRTATNDDTPTIDDFIERYCIALTQHGEKQAKAAIQNLIDRARLDEQERTGYFNYGAGDIELRFDGDISQEDRIKALEAKIKEGK